ncbi:hypothetical protein NLJ89_g7250 [Agrocybe chaxingu]|uniref:SMP-30/Gluconolactonase/LRE-like region domain-containing protein n=1 Tax=Agrocybe chaxingu TaxID=84603 RepID=A0A9W8MVM2_9AGAR|nr:hypothetical protein NLJ89_g7250 [Agrocybe chaxingu]
MNILFKITAIAVSYYAIAFARGSDNNKVSPASAQLRVPPQSVFIDPRSFAVLGASGLFRTDSFIEFFNPTNTTPPFFQIFDPGFLSILGSNPSLNRVAHNVSFAFAHEAPIYNHPTDEVFFASNDGGPLGFSDLYHNNQVGKISMGAVETALQGLASEGNASGVVEVPVTEVGGEAVVGAASRCGGLSPLFFPFFSLLAVGRLWRRMPFTNLFLFMPPTLVLTNPPHGLPRFASYSHVNRRHLNSSLRMTNGGTGPYKSSLVLITSGRGPLPPSIVLVNPAAPHNTTVVLDNFFGRQFNSLNDIKVHPKSGAFFFTDVTYGFLNHFRSAPLMPNQVYRFDPQTATLRVIATDFDRPNGIAFTPNGKIAYIADTGAAGGFLGNNQTEPATIYAFDVEPHTQTFLNRRVFAYVDAGVPDGVQVDAKGNVYSGCGDGVHVWSPQGTLLGKFFLGTTSANMVFAGDGRLVILAETSVFVAKIAAQEGKIAFG